MMTYKRLIPCLLISDGKVVTWFDDRTLLSEDPVALAKRYAYKGADELLLFDLSETPKEHEMALRIIRRINRETPIPSIAGGNINDADDVRKYLEAGCKRVMLNFTKETGASLAEKASSLYGAKRIAASLNDFDTLFKQQHCIEKCVSELIFMQKLDLNSVRNLSDKPAIIVTDDLNEENLIEILQDTAVRGISARKMTLKDFDLQAFKETCIKSEIKMSAFESKMEFSEFAVNASGLLPVILQNAKTTEVMQLAFMNEAAFTQTLKTGNIFLYDPETKDVYPGKGTAKDAHVVGILVSEDKKSLLVRVNPITPKPLENFLGRYYEPIVGSELDEGNPLQVLESLYGTIRARKELPVEGSYTNYLFDKGIDQILVKFGSEIMELIVAAKNPDTEEITNEMADMLYMIMVLMAEKNLTWEDIIQVVKDRSISF